MERGPLLRILKDMVGTDRELDLVISGESAHLEIRNVEDVFELHLSLIHI